MQWSILVCCLLLYARFLIYRCKYSKSRPNMAQYFSLLNSIKQSEYALAKKKNKSELHFRRYGQLHCRSYLITVVFVLLSQNKKTQLRTYKKCSKSGEQLSARLQGLNNPGIESQFLVLIAMSIPLRQTACVRTCTKKYLQYCRHRTCHFLHQRSASHCRHICMHTS